jgi:RsiW-degrading membrane proteinase PrsW (M82 family)
MNNKQRIFLMVLFLIWFAVGNICYQHLHFSMPMTLLINSFVVPGIMSLPCLIIYDHLGGRKLPKDFLFKDLNMP